MGIVSRTCNRPQEATPHDPLPSSSPAGLAPLVAALVRPSADACQAPEGRLVTDSFDELRFFLKNLPDRKPATKPQPRRTPDQGPSSEEKLRQVRDLLASESMDGMRFRFWFTRGGRDSKSLAEWRKEIDHAIMYEADHGST